jgi:hypothetical protein
MAVKLMLVEGKGRRTMHFDGFTGERFDYVVTLCDCVREVCPEFRVPGQAIQLEHAQPGEDGDSTGPPTRRSSAPPKSSTAGSAASSFYSPT